MATDSIRTSDGDLLVIQTSCFFELRNDMIGGIYGDLAAETYLRDPEIFYRELFDDKATLSEYGLAIFATCKYLTNRDPHNTRRMMDTDVATSMLLKANHKLADISDHAARWAADPSVGAGVTAAGMYLNRLATYYEMTDSEADDGQCVADNFADKADGYANIFMGQMMRSLRRGLSKDETYGLMHPVFRECRRNWNWKVQEDSISLLLRAWDCFYNSFDFGSAIHNAVRFPNSYTRQIASLTGLIAEAMYGCTIYYKKRRFGIPDHWLMVPNKIRREYDDVMRTMMLMYPTNRHFYRKNDSCTNVERHSYKPVSTPFWGKFLSEEEYKRFMLAYDTNEDRRIGVYKEDGWFYLHYGYDIIGRVRLQSRGGRYLITSVQVADDSDSQQIETAMRIVCNACGVQV